MIRLQIKEDAEIPKIRTAEKCYGMEEHRDEKHPRCTSLETRGMIGVSERDDRG